MSQEYNSTHFICLRLFPNSVYIYRSKCATFVNYETTLYCHNYLLYKTSSI